MFVTRVELVVPRSTSSDASTDRASDVSGSRLGTSHDVATPSTSTGGTVQARLEPHFVSVEASREVAVKVQAKLSSLSATARKMELTGEGACQYGRSGGVSYRSNDSPERASRQR